jgi:hypothetical protein
MVMGNALVTSLGFEDSEWKYFVYVFPANLGQGIIYPAILFTSLASFDHAGKPKAYVIAHSLASLTNTSSDHAVSASTVYLIRSLGTVWGVSVTSAIVQTVFGRRTSDDVDTVARDDGR